MKNVSVRDVLAPAEHLCYCGAFGAWGFGISVRKGTGIWRCYPHIPSDAAAPRDPVPVAVSKQGALL